MVKSAPSASSSASATGPILPFSVESKVEQYLKKNCRTPALRSHSSAASDIPMASSTGLVRDFRATTTASAAGTSVSGPRHPEQLHRAHAVLDQHVGEVGRAGEIVGDTAEKG